MRIYFCLFLLCIFANIGYGQKQKDEPIDYRDDLSLDWERQEDTLRLIAKSKLLTSIQIDFYSRLDSIRLKSYLLRPKDSIDLIKYAGNVNDSIFKSQFNDSVRIGYVWGHPSKIDPDYDHLYRFPFQKGKKYEVTQSFHGKRSHFSERSKYAIDFQLDMGEPVYAARGGTVVKVIDWFTKQGGEELINAANKIVILHSDGTLGFYVHLQYSGSFVKEGQIVEEGQKIGLAGLTGYTSGPHLHFVVRKENNIAIPIYFKGHEGEVLEKGEMYKVIE